MIDLPVYGFVAPEQNQLVYVAIQMPLHTRGARGASTHVLASEDQRVYDLLEQLQLQARQLVRVGLHHESHLTTHPKDK